MVSWSLPQQAWISCPPHSPLLPSACSNCFVPLWDRFTHENGPWGFRIFEQFQTKITINKELNNRTEVTSILPAGEQTTRVVSLIKLQSRKDFLLWGDGQILPFQFLTFHLCKPLIQQQETIYSLPQIRPKDKLQQSNLGTSNYNGSILKFIAEKTY